MKPEDWIFMTKANKLLLLTMKEGSRWKKVYFSTHLLPVPTLLMLLSLFRLKKAKLWPLLQSETRKESSCQESGSEI